MAYLDLLTFSIVVMITQTLQPKGLKISILPPEKNKTITVYDGNNLDKQFDQSQAPPSQSCTPPLFLALSPNKNNSTMYIIIENMGISSQVVDSASIASSSSSLIDVKVYLSPGFSSSLEPGDTTQFTVVHTCNGNIQDYNKTNYWSVIDTKILFNQNYQQLAISYEFTCDSSYRVYHVDLSLMFLVIFSSFVVTVLARFGMIYSFKLLQKKDQFTTIYFQGFSLNIWFLVVYGLVYLFIALSATLYPDQMRVPALLIITLIGFSSCLFIFNEILCVLPRNWGLKSELFRFIRTCDILSFVLATALIALYNYSYRVWYLNNLIAVCVMGVVVKLFKIQSLKAAILILLPCAMLDCIAALVAHYAQAESYDVLVLRSFNYPLELELPLFSLMFDKKCSWVSIINIVLPGLVIGYNLRYDRTRNTHIYTVLSFLGLLGGSAIWILVQVINRHSWPQSLFSYTLMISLTSIWAYKRGEWLVLWRGTFYDIYLMDPFSTNSKTQSLLSQEEKTQANDGPRLQDLIQQNQNQQESQSKYKLDKSLYQGLHYTKIYNESEADQQSEESKGPDHTTSINHDQR